VLCIGFALFLGVFALDVFGEGYGFWKTILALLIHLIPTWLVLAVLAASWRWPWVGAVLFPALVCLYIAWTALRMHWLAYLLIAGPLFLLGVLFLLDWLVRHRVRLSV
jgi:hypothetical protein